MFERSKRGEQALLIQPHAAGQFDPAVLEEFSELARSAGATVLGTLNARMDRMGDERSVAFNLGRFAVLPVVVVGHRLET